MKKILLLLLYFMFYINVNAQRTLVESTSNSFCVKYKSNWSNWTKEKKSKVTILIDYNNLRVTIFDKEVKKYKIISRDGFTESNKDIVIFFNCLGEKGEFCRIKILSPSNTNRNSIIQVNYEFFCIAYIC